MADSIERRRLLLWGGAWLAGSLVACDMGERLVDNRTKAPLMKLTSSAFEAAAFIPSQFTCDGADQSPELTWETPPAQTKSLVLILESDTPSGAVHWILYDLPPSSLRLSAAVPIQPFLTTGGVQAKNDFGDYGYRGPCPPSGTHRYFFRLYAVDKVLDLPPGATLSEIRGEMQGHLLAEAELMGRYSRQR